MPPPHTPLFFCALFVTALLTGCQAGTDTPPLPSANIAALGKKIFNDPSLSATGQLACAGCHVASLGHASNTDVNTSTNTLGIPVGQSGTRNAPSLRYLDQNPAFFFAKDGTPTGGFDRDGRANSLMDQARRPFVSPNEMANGTPANVVAKLRVASYAGEFKAVFGASIFDQGDAAFDRAVFALGIYQSQDPAFHPYTSRFDDFLRGRASLSAQEMRGLALFNAPQKGNCAACHPSARGSRGEFPLFTDFSYDTLGVPRNANIPANNDPTYFDLGLCGPVRTDLSNRADLCGAFKVPTLRNIAKTAPYFHNGRFNTLTEVLGFYVRRDTHPEEWYPVGPNGKVQKFDDLPDSAKGNVNTSEVPYNRNPGDLPALNNSEIADVVAFLNTLTDQDLLP